VRHRGIGSTGVPRALLRLTLARQNHPNSENKQEMPTRIKQQE
jgi:hypothetical protein